MLGLEKSCAALLIFALCVAAQAAEPGDVVMVKGSNGSKAGLIAQALVALDSGEAR